MSTNNSAYHATCFCGSVELELTGSPELMAYCHCDDCRHWAAGPVSRFTLWKPEYLNVVKGEEFLQNFDRNSSDRGGEAISKRTWCSRCGGHLYTDHPKMGLIDVPAVIIEKMDFTPAFHVHYQESVLPMKDGLPKFKDLPEPAGGSGEVIAE